MAVINHPQSTTFNSSLRKANNPDKLSGKYTIYGKYNVAALEFAMVSSILKSAAQPIFYGMFMVTAMEKSSAFTMEFCLTLRLRKLKRDYPETDFLFVSERKAPLTDHTFRKILTRAEDLAKLDNINVHPHMLRHSTGFKLANDGNDTRSIQLYLGHRSIQNTVRYTELSTERFKDFWRD